MKTKFIACSMIGFLYTVWGVNSAFGFPVTWEFEGEITSVFDPNDSLGGAITVGTPFSGIYTFESTTLDSQSDNLILGVYNDAITAISGQVGDIPFFASTEFTSVITVHNFGVGVDNDQYFVDILNVDIPILGDTFDFFLRYADADGAVFQTDLLPLSPPDLASSIAAFVSFRVDDNTSFNGDITMLVPEPGTFALLALGALAAIRRRRRKQRRILSVFGVLVLLSLAGTSEVRAQWTGGPVLIGGDDIDDHFTNGRAYIREGFNFLGSHVTNGKTIAVCIGCNGSDASNAFTTSFDASDLSPLGSPPGNWTKEILIDVVEIQDFFDNAVTAIVKIQVLVKFEIFHVVRSVLQCLHEQAQEKEEKDPPGYCRDRTIRC